MNSVDTESWVKAVKNMSYSRFDKLIKERKTALRGMSTLTECIEWTVCVCATLIDPCVSGPIFLMCKYKEAI